MPDSCFADRLGVLISLLPDEHAALARLEERERRVRRNGILLAENDRLTDIFVLKQGMMMSYVILGDGSRQILRFLFPGDLLATAALAYDVSPETIMALTDAVVCPVDRHAMADLIQQMPRLGVALLAAEQTERVAMTDRLAAIGRTTAKARVSALLLEFRNRLRANDPSVGDSFSPGITQEEMGDATGLTAVHVNRMLRQLEDDGMIVRDGGRFTLVNAAQMAREADYVDRHTRVDPGWLRGAAG